MKIAGDMYLVTLKRFLRSKAGRSVPFIAKGKLATCLVMFGERKRSLEVRSFSNYVRTATRSEIMLIEVVKASDFEKLGVRIHGKDKLNNTPNSLTILFRTPYSNLH